MPAGVARAAGLSALQRLDADDPAVQDAQPALAPGGGTVLLAAYARPGVIAVRALSSSGKALGEEHVAVFGAGLRDPAVAFDPRRRRFLVGWSGSKGPDGRWFDRAGIARGQAFAIARTGIRGPLALAWDGQVGGMRAAWVASDASVRTRVIGAAGAAKVVAK